MNRPTISTPRRSNCLRKSCSNTKGTLLLVSHDRVFLNNVVTSTLVFEGAGQISEYTGGYEDWIRQRDAARAAAVLPPPIVRPSPSKPTPIPAPEKPPKFLNREKRELEELPAEIEKWEAELTDLQAQLWDPAIYKDQPGTLTALKNGVASLENRIKAAYARWEELETRRKLSEI